MAGRDPRGSADDGGMIDAEEFEALQAEAGDAEAPPVDPDELPTVSEQRLRELKDTARKQIEERLKSRRRQRKLLRGGEAP